MYLCFLIFLALLWRGDDFWMKKKSRKLTVGSVCSFFTHTQAGIDRGTCAHPFSRWFGDLHGEERSELEKRRANFIRSRVYAHLWFIRVKPREARIHQSSELFQLRRVAKKINKKFLRLNRNYISFFTCFAICFEIYDRDFWLYVNLKWNLLFQWESL